MLRWQHASQAVCCSGQWIAGHACRSPSLTSLGSAADNRLFGSELLTPAHITACHQLQGFGPKPPGRSSHLYLGCCRRSDLGVLRTAHWTLELSASTCVQCSAICCLRSQLPRAGCTMQRYCLRQLGFSVSASRLCKKLDMRWPIMVVKYPQPTRVGSSAACGQAPTSFV